MHIVTIGGGNGQSYFLRSLRNIQQYHSGLKLTSIVSMSDDGRTTGKLMRAFAEHLGVHLPPPGDFRRPLYVLSRAENIVDLEASMEEVLNLNNDLYELTLMDYIAGLQGIAQNKREAIEQKYASILDANIAIYGEKIEGYKRGNLLMACLFCAYDYSLERVMETMHDILDVDGLVIPVTLDKALIQGVTRDGQLVRSQDAISNHPELYTGPIEKLEFMEGSQDAKIHPDIPTYTQDADYIIVTPGDIYTSLAANFIVHGIREWIQGQSAALILVMNPTNKGGEAQGLSADDFIEILEGFLGRPFDVIIANRSSSSTDGFRDDISVKGGNYVYLSDHMREMLLERGTDLHEIDLLHSSATYRFDANKLENVIRSIIDVSI